MNKVCYISFKVRFLLLISLLFLSAGLFADGFTPSDGGLVANLKPGDKILLSTWVDVNGNGIEEEGEEFFVCNYPGKTGTYFNYKAKPKNSDPDSLMLLPQNHLASEPSSTSIWEIDNAMVRPAGQEMDGICYTMWNFYNDKKYYPYLTDKFRTKGQLTNRPVDNKQFLADVVFVVPTRVATASFDPDSTLGRHPKFSAKKGIGFLGMPYREVYWLHIPYANAPISYTNASVVGFNTTLANYVYARDNKGGKKDSVMACPGRATYAFADPKHKPTQRTLFRLYVLDEPTVSACPESRYYFAYSQRFRGKYRTTAGKYTAVKSTVTMDLLTCMERDGSTKYYQTDWMLVPDLDSCRYYVGYQNHFPHKKDGAPFEGAYTYMDSLPLQYMPRLKAPKGALGRMIVDTTNTGVDNLGVVFRPAGVFLKAETGRNIEMEPEEGDTSWISVEKWHVEDAYGEMEFKATLYTEPTFSPTDPGHDIAGWSVPVKGKNVPLVGGGSVIGKDGWCRVYVNKSTPNGGLEFVAANPDLYVRYNNNNHFGDTIPTAYPRAGQKKVVIQADRLLSDYDFAGWTSNAEGTGHLYQPGDTVNLDTVPGNHLILYAQAEYKGNIRVAISFMQDGKRYFLTHPGTAPRFAKARHFDDWTNTWQGMANVENLDPNYMSTYLMIGKNNICKQCESNEYVLDPQRETMYGAEDSVTFYEHFKPEKDEYIGLYYTYPNTVLSNNSWAGLFQSSEGWPEPTQPCIDSTKLFSTHYLYTDTTKVKWDTVRTERPNHAQSYIKYAPSADGNFNGVATAGEATDFTLSGVGVVDEHYVIIPDTARSDQRWTDQIVFDLHSDKYISKQVWSKLIGKQLMMQMQLGNEIVYFHPNNDKTFTTPNQLAISRDYRLTQSFEFIRDARVTTVSDDDRPHMTESTDDFCRMINSGLNSPIDVIYNDKQIDIVDTVRVSLRSNGGKIKDYYGIWKDGAPGLHVRADGSRYRDILVITKTYHHGPTVDSLMLVPEYPSYSFSPLAEEEKEINFTLSKVRVRELHGVNDEVLGVEILSSEDVSDSLHITSTQCSFTGGTTYFQVKSALKQEVAVETKLLNQTEADYDTLVVKSVVTLSGVTDSIKARVPLMQTAMNTEEIVWSVYKNGKRYFIMAGSGGLIFRQFELKSNTLYKKEDGGTQLIKGSANAANSDTRYITPWHFYMVDHALKQLRLETQYDVDKFFRINEQMKPDVGASGAILTYEYIEEHINDNANFEEQVKIRYDADKWLKFTATEDTVYLSLTTDHDSAAVFSWTYLQQEYYIQNSGAYPDKSYLEFGYNGRNSATVQTCYKAYRVYSMLLNNTLTYCGREDENDLRDLINASGDWKTRYSVTHIRDSRFSSGASGLSYAVDSTTLKTTVTPSGDSPLDKTYGGNYVNIVDTLDVQISQQGNQPHYRFRGQWSDYTSFDDSHLKIPLIRRTYHVALYDSLICTVDSDEYTFVFPPEITASNNTHTFTLKTEHLRGTNVFDVDNRVVAFYNSHDDEHTSDMHLNDPALAEIRLIEDDGNTPDWCEISSIGDNTVTVHCLGN